MRAPYIARCMRGRFFMQRLCEAAAIDIDFLRFGAHLDLSGGDHHEGVTTMLAKRLTLVSSLVLLTAIAGLAASRPAHSGMQHSSNAAMFSSYHHTRN